MSLHEIVERRSKPRIQAYIPATLRGSDKSGKPFEIEAYLDNLSTTGLHVCLGFELEPGASLSASVMLAGMAIEANGLVKRVELQPDGWFGFGVAFDSYRVGSAQ